ncbi:MAG: AAA family ATPase [Saprospiraceae bacterium]
MKKPIILLAFANDRPGASGYLRNLPLELNRLRTILERAEDKGLCEVELLPTATLDNLISTFQRERLRDRIAILHYGGHAEDDQLLLTNEQGGISGAKADGLVPFLSRQKGLQLVFLNGCYSVLQAQALVEGGVPAVIGTITAINDQLATELAIHFYRAISEGSTLEQAWSESTFTIQAQLGKTQVEAYYRQASEESSQRGIGGTRQAKRFPWEIHFRAGAEEARQWNLPDACANPYFGLPAIPAHYPYPDQPYQFLSRYHRDHARVFFGRGSYIRDLYHRIVSPHTAPIIMLYGRSGVGKSSLLEAGLFPRLEETHEIIHLRRDPSKGLVLQLLEVLGLKEGRSEAKSLLLEQEASIDQLIDRLQALSRELDNLAKEELAVILRSLQEKRKTISQPQPEDAPKAWQQLGASDDQRACLVILDQVEEIYTRPIGQQADELEALMQLLQQMFEDRSQHNNNKLILSYRKEYDPEIEKALRHFSLPKEKVFLDKLSQTDIVEIVQGLGSTDALRGRYRIQVEEGLGPLMAKQLLADQDSPVSPVLQIIMTKLWQQEEQNYEREFTVQSFQQLQQKGLLLEDFFQEQMAAIRFWEQQIQQHVETSGLALDILHAHTTLYATAGSRSLEELREKYEHRAAVLEELLQQFKSLYLLAGSSEGYSTLIHDTLAPIIQKEIRDSDRPGQRAMRILGTKMLEVKQGQSTTVLDEDDLALVEQGASGMRMWTAKERGLIEKSRQRRTKRLAERARNRQIKLGGVVVITLLAVISTLLWQKSERDAQVSLMVSEAFQLEKTDATLALGHLNKALGIQPANKIAQQARHDIYTNNEFYTSSFSLGREIPVTWASFIQRDSLVLTCQDKVISLWDRSCNLIDSLRLENRVIEARVLPQNKKLLLYNDSKDLTLVNLEDKSTQGLSGHEFPVSAIAITEDGKFFLSGDLGGNIILWNNDGTLLQQFNAHATAISSLCFTTTGQQWVSGGMDGEVHLFSIEGERLATYPHPAKITALTVIPNDTFLLTGLRSGEIWKWSLGGQHLGTYVGHKKRVNAIRFLTEEQHILSASDDQTVLLWDKAGTVLKTYRGHGNFVHTVQPTVDGRHMVTASEDGTSKLWKLRSKIEEAHFFEQGSIQSLALSPNNDLVLVGIGEVEQTDINALEAEDFFAQFDQAESYPVLVFDRDRQSMLKLGEHLGKVTAVAVQPQQEYYLSGGEDTKIVLWDSKGSKSVELDHHQGTIFSLAFSPDGQYFLSGSADHQAMLWSIPGDSIASFPHPDVVSGVLFLPGTTDLLTGCYDGWLRMWSRSGELIQEWAGGGGTIETLALSPNGDYIASGHGGTEAALKIWDRQGKLRMSRDLLEKDKSGGQAIYSIAFTPNNQRIACGGAGGWVKVFSLEGAPIQTLTQYQQTPVVGLGLISGGHQLIIGAGKRLYTTNVLD